MAGGAARRGDGGVEPDRCPVGNPGVFPAVHNAYGTDLGREIKAGIRQVHFTPGRKRKRSLLMFRSPPVHNPIQVRGCVQRVYGAPLRRGFCRSEAGGGRPSRVVPDSGLRTPAVLARPIIGVYRSR